MVLATVNGVDITPYLNKKNYKINSEKEYESWQDGNFVEHRVYVRSRVQGSFEVAVWGRDGMDYNAFLNNWNAAVTNNVVTIGLFCLNENRFRAIQAYYEIDSKKHESLINGNYFDKVTIKITEC